MSTEILVIGGGPGGYVSAIRAGQHGKDVTLVERDAYGGVCLNRGCIPSKAFVTVADLVHRSRTAEHMGVDATVEVDFPQLRSWQAEVVDQLTGGVEQLCTANGVTLVEGTAMFESPGEVVVRDGSADGPDRISFESAMIATGSRPVQVPGFEPDGESVLTSADVFALPELPDSLLVVGGGYIGMELSTVLAKLGTDVTVIEMMDRILAPYEADIADIVHEEAEALGIDIRTNEAASNCTRTDDGVAVTTTSGDNESEFEADNVLVAVGREPVTDTLALDTAGVEVTEDGFITTDRQGRTSQENIHAIGDVVGEPMLAHKASRQGEVVADVLAGEPAAYDYRAVPAAVFTDPEVGTVGLTEAETESQGFEPLVGTFPLDASGRALTLDESNGFVRVVADAATERILGGQIVGPEASELIGELALAVEVGARIEDVVSTIHTHPTLSEAVMEASADARGEAVHIFNR
ncbi:dihydrolipoyl dehydrogenase [Natrinema sp. DC36]|uniref:dihydrolipoyl dehydrogenase n=1 Tax=Natrinema sp. DC36 TaxID=2878680 RepID=UPI001CF09259|nr:dihydrolipoyl dehydrogenase [Natrinema sp. DC36]